MYKTINTVVTDMPTTISGFVRENADLSHTVVLNARMSRDRQLEAYMHELEHIENKDFEKEDVQAIETAAHK